MWIGTDIGLNRLDGHSFKKFYQGTKTLPLLSSAIRNVKSFGPYHLGIINRGGFQLLNTKDLSVKNYIIPDTTAFSVYRNAAWDACQLPHKSFAVTTASGFYVFDEAGKLSFRNDAYQLKDIGQKRILYGRDIFTLNNKEYLVYVNGNGHAYYNAEKKIFHEISKEQKEWAIFYPATPKTNFGWTSHYQLSPDEFIFIQFGDDKILYYNRALNKTIVSPLQLPVTEFSWESKITMLTDSSFLVNSAYPGFYLFHNIRKS